jgi:prepilin-type N-terminal cleavage/methylation domain-containing protein
MSAIPSYQRTTSHGFTIVELLVVIVVIAILAAITVVAYNGVQARAYGVVITSDLANIVKKIEFYKVDNGAYPTANFPDSIGIRVSKSAYKTGRNNLYYCVDATGSKYAMTSISKADGAYTVISGGAVQSASGTVDAGTNCALVSLTYPPSGGSAAFAGYDWDTGTSTGAWDSWAQG